MYGSYEEEWRKVQKARWDSRLTNSITPFMQANGMSAETVVSQLRAEVETTTGLTISAGIAPNRMLAKVRTLSWLIG